MPRILSPVSSTQFEIEHARQERPQPDFFLRPGDHAALRELQTAIEAGERFVLVGSPEGREGERYHPIKRVV